MSGVQGNARNDYAEKATFVTFDVTDAKTAAAAAAQARKLGLSKLFEADKTATSTLAVINSKTGVVSASLYNDNTRGDYAKAIDERKYRSSAQCVRLGSSMLSATPSSTLPETAPYWPVRWSAFRRHLTIESSASLDDVKAVIRLAKQGCFIEQLISRALPIEATYTVNGSSIDLS